MSNNPESTIAQSFAADLDDMFGLAASDAPRRPAPSGSDDASLHTAGVSGLVEQVDQKKQALNTKDAELQALEAKLKEAEERLAKVSRNASPARGATVPQPQANVGAARNPPSDIPAEKAAHPLAQKPGYPPDRPPTQRENTQQMMSGMPGYMPPEVEPRPTQTGSGGSSEYVMVDNEGAGRGAAR